MDKVYLVTTGDYSSYGVVAVYSTQEKAQKLVDLMKDGDIEEYDLDMETGEYTRWMISMSKDGSICWKTSKDTVFHPESPSYHLNSVPNSKIKKEKYLLYIVTCKTEEQAIKAANEVRTQLIALNKWE